VIFAKHLLGDNHITETNYSNNDYYHYTYDAVGNRRTQTTYIAGVTSVATYNYDHANRLTDVDGVTYVYDNNGNTSTSSVHRLLNDGVTAYTYDSANRLKTLNGQGNNVTYAYNRLGDRIRQTVNGQTTNYTLDLNAGLTQVLNDGTNTYLYGNERIAQVNTTTEYFLGDALGSVRQLVDTSGDITLAKSYQPYGETLSSAGSETSPFAYTGEQVDASGLVYLRARYYAPGIGRFFQKDPSRLEQNTYQYAASNPINFSDPSSLLFWYFSGGRASLIGNPDTYNRHNRFAHPWIEYWVEQQNGFWNTHAEFAGGNSFKIDLIVFDRVNPRGFNSSPVDFGVPVMGSVFEIEPANPLDIIKGWTEIQVKEAMISSGARPFVHSAFCQHGIIGQILLDQ